eukprot:GHVR01020659.1.p2 GENE.GHVR01020659.1~~GHVR01020659.1.p2  ORF type:complete len:116 (+),score=8.18 GHVR01020659.1:343-690(+)
MSAMAIARNRHCDTDSIRFMPNDAIPIEADIDDALQLVEQLAEHSGLPTPHAARKHQRGNAVGSIYHGQLFFHGFHTSTQGLSSQKWFGITLKFGPSHRVISNELALRAAHKRNE